MMKKQQKKPQPPTSLGGLIEEVGLLMHTVKLMNERMNNLEDAVVKMVELLRKTIKDEPPNE